MADFKLTIKANPAGFKSEAMKRILRNLGKLPEHLAKVGQSVTQEIQRNLSGRILNRRTGNLHDSWNWQMSPTSVGWRLAVGSNAAYARIQDLGGWTGAGHKTKIRKTNYTLKAVVAKKAQIRRIMRNYIARLSR